MKFPLLTAVLFQALVSTKSAAIYDQIKALSDLHPSTQDNLVIFDKPLQEPKRDFHLQTTTSSQEIEPTNSKPSVFTIGSVVTSVLAILIPLKACYSSDNCKQYVLDFFTLNDRRKRDLEYLETILVALLDNFVEHDVQEDRSHVQEIARPSYAEPLLVTLAKYFDKYADKTVKNHAKALVFFLVHVLGKIFGIFQYVIKLFSQYHIL
ncbi:unnamed protein product [Psylliodes chrysocephalus]|uniref:Uncharacterized protein n=1 Tax=Psylliodes chrysocephalus TaxID=3402493 RepID=A0A9P0GEP0_9CUCU|nr:unnamed protein product [Psylliodes chrysocephala]